MDDFTFNRRRALAAMGGVLALAPADAGAPPRLNDRLSGDITGVHDPAIIRAGDTYYLFSTTLAPRGDPKKPQIPCRTSQDLIHWRLSGYVLPRVPEWAVAAVPGIRDIWAPDITYCNGRYWLYYACSTGGSNHSAIGLATTPVLGSAAHWTDHGLVLASQERDDFNAIDPAHLVDRQGRRWLAFGSFWSGLKLVALDRDTGKPPHGPLQLHPLAERSVPQGAPDAIEASFLFERVGWYYLVASYDWCCKGANSTYYTVIGRSRDVLGPYVGRDGKPMQDGYGTVLLRADFRDRDRFRGPGHCAILRDPGRDYIVYHAYDAQNQGVPTLRIAPLVWSPDGWPDALM
jgi:arabinan endo-1,5-alpha-L-arabinosidase